MPGDLMNTIEYNSDYKLEDDEWFAITEFSTKEYCIEFLRTRFISTDYNQLPRAGYLDYFAYQSGSYCFEIYVKSNNQQKVFFPFRTNLN